MNIDTKSPSLIVQHEGQSPTPGEALLDWNFNQFVIDQYNYAETTKTLRTIAGTNGMLFRNATRELWTTDYNFSNVGNTVLGIELILQCKRVSRIQDYVVQLCLNGELIGENQAILHHVPENVKTYGSTTSTWSAELTADDIKSNSFGVVISFQSNDQYPHNDLGFISQVELKIYSA